MLVLLAVGADVVDAGGHTGPGPCRFQGVAQNADHLFVEATAVLAVALCAQVQAQGVVGHFGADAGLHIDGGEAVRCLFCCVASRLGGGERGVLSCVMMFLLDRSTHHARAGLKSVLLCGKGLRECRIGATDGAQGQGAGDQRRAAGVWRGRRISAMRPPSGALSR